MPVTAANCQSKLLKINSRSGNNVMSDNKIDKPLIKNLDEYKKVVNDFLSAYEKLENFKFEFSEDVVTCQQMDSDS
ncbi:MAG: hypothetical protein LC109_03955 [Bacteroidia bacterium]|nr:hypothetical protein [Bacteroidia bacterium]